MISIRKASKVEPKEVVQKTIECYVSAFSRVEANMALAGDNIDILRQQAELRIPDRFSSSCEVYLAETEDKQVVGIAMWKPPAELEDTSVQGERHNSEAYDRSLALMSAEMLTWWREEFVPGQERLLESSFGDDFKSTWYLAMLCVHQDYQGQGLARKLLTPGMQKAVSQNRSMSLDTPSPHLVKLYERFGFQLRGQADFHAPSTKVFTAYAMLCPFEK